MDHSVAGVVLAAGSGQRLRPLTDLMAKPLCPVGNKPLLHWAAERLSSVTASVAVNAHHHAPQIIDAAGPMHVSVEDVPLGTAGALAGLSDWIDGRPVAVVNGDTWSPGGLEHMLHGWDGETVRVLVPGAQPFGPRSIIAGTLLPWRTVAALALEPTGLYEVVWRDAHADGRLEVVDHPFPVHDCGTPAQLLHTNLSWLDAGQPGAEQLPAIHPTAVGAGRIANSVVGAGADVQGSVESSLVLAGATVNSHEQLVSAIRYRLPDGSMATIAAPPGAAGS